MSAFSGPQGKGAMCRHRKEKRLDAEERAAVVKHADTKAHRLGRCAHAGGAA